MTHGDDDGLRMPPKIAPRQIVIVPMLRDKPEDAGIEGLLRGLGEGSEGARHPGAGRYEAGEIRREALELGAPRSACHRGNRRPRCCGRQRDVHAPRCLRDGDKVVSQTQARADFVSGAVALLDDIQARLYAEAKARLDQNIVTTIKSFEDLQGYFGDGTGDDEDGDFKGWALVAWSKPEGEQLEAVAERLKALKLTIRNAPLAQPDLNGRTCLFTGEPACEFVLIGRSY